MHENTRSLDLLDGKGLGESANGGLGAAHTLLAGVVEPSQANIIHPPNLWLALDGEIDANRVEVLEIRVEGDGNKNTTQALEIRTSRYGVLMGGNFLSRLSDSIVSVAGECEVTIRAKRITAE